MNAFVSDCRAVRVALIGECMVELRTLADGHLVQGFSGDTLNTAVYLARLCTGLPVTIDYITALGDDVLSQAMRQLWRSEGVNDSHVRVIDRAQPGLYMIHTDARGERRFVYWRGESAARRCFDGPDAIPLLECLGDYEVIYLSGISLAILSEQGRERLLERLSTVRLQGTRIVFDNNYRPTLWRDQATARHYHQALLALTDLALVTWEDDVALFDFASAQELFAAYAQWGVTEVALKRGSDSCLLFCDRQTLEVPAEPVERVVDTTAAGDAFSAAYLAARLQGATPQAAAQCGHRLAGTVIQHRGALIEREAMPRFSHFNTVQA